MRRECLTCLLRGLSVMVGTGPLREGTHEQKDCSERLHCAGGAGVPFRPSIESGRSFQHDSPRRLTSAATSGSLVTESRSLAGFRFLEAL